MAPGTSDCQRLLRALVGTPIDSVEVLLPLAAAPPPVAVAGTLPVPVEVEERVLSRISATSLLPSCTEGPAEAQSP
jgi:hypothetical protein